MLVFDNFLLKSVTRENVARHTLRLVEYIFQKLPALRLSSLQNQLAPKDEVSLQYIIGHFNSGMVFVWTCYRYLLSGIS